MEGSIRRALTASAQAKLLARFVKKMESTIPKKEKKCSKEQKAKLKAIEDALPKNVDDLITKIEENWQP